VLTRQGGWPASGFGEGLKQFREGAGLTQQELADEAGFHGFTLAKLEQGMQEPAWPRVLALARVLGVNCLAFVPEEGTTATPAKRGPGRRPKQDARLEATPKQGKGRKPKGGTGKGEVGD
jgi:transcriptional regulator with XRE-family HTH domain